MYCLQDIHPLAQILENGKIKEGKSTHQANGNHEATGIVILISDKVDSKPKLFKRDKSITYLKGELLKELRAAGGSWPPG